MNILLKLLRLFRKKPRYRVFLRVHSPIHGYQHKPVPAIFRDCLATSYSDKTYHTILLYKFNPLIKEQKYWVHTSDGSAYELTRRVKFNILPLHNYK